MKHLCKHGAGILFALLNLSACSESNDYPKEYVGFDKITETHTFSREIEEQDISIKIIAAEKKDTDREVILSGKWKPGEEPVFKLLDTRVVIPAKKKSANARVRIYPKKMKDKGQVRIFCSPKDNEAKQSQLTLKLVLK